MSETFDVIQEAIRACRALNSINKERQKEAWDKIIENVDDMDVVSSIEFQANTKQWADDIEKSGAKTHEEYEEYCNNRNKEILSTQIK